MLSPFASALPHSSHGPTSLFFGSRSNKSRFESCRPKSVCINIEATGTSMEFKLARVTLRDWILLTQRGKFNLLDESLQIFCRSEICPSNTQKAFPRLHKSVLHRLATERGRYPSNDLRHQANLSYPGALVGRRLVLRAAPSRTIERPL